MYTCVHFGGKWQDMPVQGRVLEKTRRLTHYVNLFFVKSAPQVDDTVLATQHI